MRLILFTIIFCFWSQIVLSDGCSSVSFTATASPNLLCSIDFVGLSVQNTDCDYSQPYDYYWDFGDGSPIVYTTMNPSYQYQASGLYDVTFTWEGICHGSPTICFTTQSVQITLPPPPPITSSTSIYSYYDQATSNYIDFNVSCFGENDGWISLSSIGSYIYEWQTTPPQYGSNINGLNAGSYDVLSILNGCPTQALTVNLIEPPQIIANQIITNASCYSYNNGNIDLAVIGGVSPYNYLWSNGDITEDRSNLVAATYSVDITDTAGCIAPFSFQVIEPTPLQTTIVASTDYNGYDIRCYGYSDGGIDLTVTGSVPGYIYLWSNGAATEDISNASVGGYDVVVTDQNSCTITTSIILQQPDEITLSIDVYPDTCAKQVGKVENIQISGGVPSYIYSWNIPEPPPIAVQVLEGEYYIEIEDLNNCLINDTIIITNLGNPEIDFTIISTPKHLYDQLYDPIVFIDMTTLPWWSSALYWHWDFGDGTYGTDSIAFHSYQEIGEYNVLLQITTDYNCIDTLVKKVVIKEYDLFIPNAFTPNSSDDINKGFRPYGIGIDEFLMNIYSRWDGLIYSTTKIEEEWNGKFNNSGKECQLGVYVYYIKVKDIFGAIHEYEGQVLLIR